MKKFFLFLNCSAFLGMMLLCGCASADQLAPSDLTVKELEQRMQKAMDPAGNFANCRTAVIRQTVETPQFLDDPIESMIETKMQRPNRFRITSYTDNEPVQIICSDGVNGWIADVQAKEVKELDGPQLNKLLTLSRLSSPGRSYSLIFSKVEIFKCRNEEGEFYLLDCTGSQQDRFRIYVDTKRFFVRRVRGEFRLAVGTLEYDSRILSYGRREGVMIPTETEMTQNGQVQTSKITSYHLNENIPATEFLPPVM